MPQRFTRLDRVDRVHGLTGTRSNVGQEGFPVGILVVIELLPGKAGLLWWRDED
jgi:hypothetical protein